MMVQPSFMLLDMVISKSGAVVHPRPCLKETMLPVGHGILTTSPLTLNATGTSTLPRVRSITRSVTRRVAELPSLRYGTVGAACTISGPLRVRDTLTTMRKEDKDRDTVRKYQRSFTAGVLGDDVPAIRVARRVRFDLPPPDDSPRISTTFASSSHADVASSAVNYYLPSSQHHQHQQSFATSSLPRTSATTSAALSRSQALNRSTSSLQHIGGASSSPLRHYYTTTDLNRNYRGAPPVSCVTITSSTVPVVRERAHPVGTYVRGTLSPTSHAAVGAVEAPLHGSTPLLLRAAREADEQLIREAIRQVQGGVGVRDVNAVDSSGRTALSYVASNGTVDLLESILQLPSVDPNLPDNEGNTPLHFAAQAGQVECLNFLLSRCQGLEIDARNHLGFTPLMKAALQGRNKCAKLLLFAGANPTLRDTGKGLRAEQWARYCGRYVCADVIEKFARHRLLERSTSCGRWGSDSDIGGTRLLLGKVVPVPPQTQLHHQVLTQQSQGTGIKSKLRKVFRTSSGPSPDSSASARLITQLTSAALCASSPVLPAAPTVPPVVKSLIRPLTVPRLQITLANGAATISSDIHGFSAALLDQENQQNIMDKPPRTKKKMK